MNLVNYLLIIFIYFATNVKSEITDYEILERYEFVSNSGNHFKTRPPGMVNHSYHEPVIVRVNSAIDLIEGLNEKEMVMQVQMDLCTSWQDPRLNSSLLRIQWPDTSKYIRLDDTSTLWTPKLYFSKNKNHRDPTEYLCFTRLFSNGSLLVCKRHSLTLPCPMGLKRFPFDTQICVIKIYSYGDASKDVILEWSDNNSSKVNKNGIMLPSITLEQITTSKEIIKTLTGEYSSLSIHLLFDRDSHFYLMKFHWPVVIVVLISWLPFWLGRVLILRIYIAFSAIVFLGWHYLAQPNELTVSYYVLLDFWRIVNLIFVFLAASQSILITYMIKTNTNKIKRIHPDDNENFKMLKSNNCPEKKRYLEVAEEKTDIDLEIMKIKANFKICFINVQKEVELIDSASKLFFPSAYCIFVFFYWLKC